MTDTCMPLKHGVEHVTCNSSCAPEQSLHYCDPWHRMSCFVKATDSKPEPQP